MQNKHHNNLTISYGWFFTVGIIFLQSISLFILKYDDSYGQTMVYKLLYFLNYIGAFIFAFLSFTNVGPDLSVKSHRRSFCWSYLKYEMAFWVLILLFLPLHLYLNGTVLKYGSSYFTRLASLYINRLSIILTAYGLYVLCGNKIIGYVTSLFSVMYILWILFGCLLYGPVDIMKTFLAGFGIGRGGLSTLFLEVHEITFVLGLYIIYYLFAGKRYGEKKGVFILACIAFIMGGKRIGVAGLLFALFLHFLLHKLKKKQAIVYAWGICVILCTLFYIYSIYDWSLFGFFAKVGIHPMGRDLLYRYFRMHTDFSLGFTGLGFGAVSTIFQFLTPVDIGHLAGMIVDLHSDIFKNYIELGMLGNLCWLIFQFLFIPKKLKQIYGERTQFFYCILMTYAYITYLTDNTQSYYLFQSMLLCMVICIGAHERSIKRR